MAKDYSVNEYSKTSFSDEEISFFIENNISPDIANAYRKRELGLYYNDWGNVIKDLFTKKISPKTVNNFDQRFNISDIKEAMQLKVHHSIANAYHSSFEWNDIIFDFEENKISSDLANKYVLFNEHECNNKSDVFLNKCSCGERLSIFQPKHIVKLAEKNISVEFIKEVMNNLNPELKKSFLKGYNNWIAENALTATYIKSSSNLAESCNDLYEQAKNLFKIPSKDRFWYSSNSAELIYGSKPMHEINAEIFRSLNVQKGDDEEFYNQVKKGKYIINKENFQIVYNSDLKDLEELEISFEKIKEYIDIANNNGGISISAEDVLLLSRAGISTVKFDEKITNLKSLVNKEFKIYRKDFTKKSSVSEIETKKGLGVSARDITWIIKEEIEDTTITHFKEFHRFAEIIYSSIAKSNDAFGMERLDRKTTVWELRHFIEDNLLLDRINFENFQQEDKYLEIVLSREQMRDRGILEIDNSIFNHEIMPWKEEEMRAAAYEIAGDKVRTKERGGKWKLIGFGSRGFVIYGENSELKHKIVSKYMSRKAKGEEARILYHLEEFYKKEKLKNVINLSSLRDYIMKTFFPGIPERGLLLEYVKGDNLENILQDYKSKSNNLNPEKIKNYSRGILNGIQELFNADVTHRDLHPGNIIINEETENPVIIDLGIARIEDESYPVDPKDCRRYGGFDDLFSFGLLVYKIATNRHLLMEYSAKNKGKEYENLESSLRLSLSTGGNASWIQAHKNEMLNNDGSLKEEYSQFIHEKLRNENLDYLKDIIEISLGVSAYLNKHLSDENKLTIEDMNSGKKISYELIRPIKEKLFGELLDYLK